MNRLVKAHKHIKREHCPRELCRSIILTVFICEGGYFAIYSFFLIYNLWNVWACSIRTFILSHTIHTTGMKKARRPVEKPPGTSDGMSIYLTQPAYPLRFDSIHADQALLLFVIVFYFSIHRYWLFLRRLISRYDENKMFLTTNLYQELSNHKVRSLIYLQLNILEWTVTSGWANS